jgi:hypothetical protein
MMQTRTITIANAMALRLLQDIANLHLIRFVDSESTEGDSDEAGEAQPTPSAQDELTNRVNAVCSQLTKNDNDAAREVSNAARTTVWETLKNDTW